jgi:tetratricopeptide (TPR) repeat protein
MLIKNGHNLGALNFLNQFDDHIDSKIYYLLGRVHLELGNFEEGLKTAEYAFSLDKSVDNIGLLCCAHLLKDNPGAAIELFDSNTPLSQFPKTQNAFMMIDMKLFIQPMIEIVKSIKAQSENFLTHLNELFRFLAYTSNSCFERKVILTVITKVFLSINKPLEAEKILNLVILIQNSFLRMQSKR